MVFDVLKSLAAVICVVLLMIGMANALGGKAKELPVIGGIRLFSVKAGNGSVEEPVTESINYTEEGKSEEL